MLLISACVLIYIGNYAWKRDKRYVTLSLVPIIIYSFGYGIEILCTSLEWVMFFVKIEYLGIAFLPAVWLLFVLQFLGYKDKINKYILRLLYVIPIIILIMVYTNDFHHLFYKEVYMNNDGLFPIVELVKGPWYWVNIVYTYMSMSIG
ncbi:histidine kinase N-terminal 7TM domain-containing protein, partial [Clostridium saccharoperbutylacetonicum]